MYIIPDTENLLKEYYKKISDIFFNLINQMNLDEKYKIFFDL